MKTSEEIFDKCIQLSKASILLGLDENYELKNCRDIWKKEKWFSEDEIKKAIAKCYSYGHAEPLTNYYNEKDDNLICVAQLLELLFNSPDLNSMR